MGCDVAIHSVASCHLRNYQRSGRSRGRSCIARRCCMRCCRGECRYGCHGSRNRNSCHGRCVAQSRCRCSKHQLLLLRQKSLKGFSRGLLAFQELAVQLRGILLHLLQDSHAVPGYPDRLAQSRMRGSLDRGGCRMRLVRCRSSGAYSRSGCRGRSECLGRSHHACCLNRGCIGHLRNLYRRRCYRLGLNRRPLRLRLDVVRAAKRDGHGWFFALRCCGFMPFIPGGEVHAAAADCQLGQGAGQIGYTGAFSG